MLFNKDTVVSLIVALYIEDKIASKELEQLLSIDEKEFLRIARERVKCYNILNKWANLEGHDKCWHHPEILTELCNILQIPIKDPPVLPSREAFEDGCRCYADKLYPNTSLENNHKLCGSNNDIQGTIRYGPLYEIFYGEYKEGFGSLKGYKYYQLLGDYPVIDGNPDKFTPTFILCNRRPPYDHLYNEFKRNYIDFTRITEIDFDNLLYSWYCRPLMESTS